MIKVLIVDDDLSKIDRIKSVFDQYDEIHADDITVTSSLIDAKKHLRAESYDLLILDVQIPNRDGEDPLVDGGMTLLSELHSRSCFRKPTCVIGLTAFPESFRVADSLFSEKLWNVVLFEFNSSDWINRLRTKLQYLIDAKSESRATGDYGLDLCVITALNTLEFRALNNLSSWECIRFPNDDTIYHKTVFEGNSNPVKVACACSPEMGIPAATVLSSKLISHFSPRYLAMVGITGGVSGRVELGDFLVADPCWDWGAGKRVGAKCGGILEPDPSQLRLDPKLRSLFQDVQLDQDLLSSVWDSWSGSKPSHPPSLHIGPSASGSSVVADQDVVISVAGHNRKLLGIEMEAYGVMHAAFNSMHPKPSAFSLKVVSDFADAAKSDDFQEYSAYASATLLQKIAAKYF